MKQSNIYVIRRHRPGRRWQVIDMAMGDAGALLWGQSHGFPSIAKAQEFVRSKFQGGKLVRLEAWEVTR